MSETSKVLSEHSHYLSKLHAHLRQVKRFPHEGQAQIIRAFFNEKKKIIQGQCGRSLGKTEAVIYISTRYALTNPGTETYIICPEIKQAKKIYWLKKRLQTYGPQEFVLEHRESELRTVFRNGSYIILDGCENYEALRGIKPNLVIYDEFQHHTPYFDEEVMQPNLSGGNVSLLVFGTPPKRHCYYVDFRENLLTKVRDGNGKVAYFELPSISNPSLDKEWLEEKRTELIRRDKFNVWQREYEGRLVFDTENAIFPFFSEKKHVKPHDSLMKLIHRDRKKLNYYALYDPGTTTVFAALFIAHNPYTSQIFLLDEIYAEEKRECTSSAIYLKALKIKEDLYDYEDSWLEYYDEAAAWFANEVQDQFSKHLIPTRKQASKASNDEGRAGESILNTVMDSPNLFFVSSRCKKFVWEISNYVMEEKRRMEGDGKQFVYPRTHDHLMDLLFYFVNETRYSIIEEVDRSLETHETDTVKRNVSSIDRAIQERAIERDPSLLYGEDMFDDSPGDGLWN